MHPIVCWFTCSLAALPDPLLGAFKSTRWSLKSKRRATIFETLGLARYSVQILSRFICTLMNQRGLPIFGQALPLV